MEFAIKPCIKVSLHGGCLFGWGKRSHAMLMKPFNAGPTGDSHLISDVTDR